MRRVIQLLICVVLTVGGIATTPTPAQAHHKAGPCHQIHWRHPQGESVTDAVQRLIRCAVRRWSVPGGVTKALDVARCESGFRPRAVGYGNYGVYQHRLPYWRGRAIAYLRPRWDTDPHTVSPFNAWANVIVAIRMAHGPGGWSPWSCA